MLIHFYFVTWLSYFSVEHRSVIIMATNLQQPQFKCVIVGDTNIGKSSIWSLFTLGECRDCLAVSYADKQSLPKIVTVDGKTCKLDLYNSAGNEDYDRLRPLNYFKTDVFLICFSLVDRQSFENVLNKWYPEVDRFMPKTPKILVGTKLDLRKANADESTEITYAEGLAMTNNAENVKCYIECSTLTGLNMDMLFDEVVRTAFKYPVIHKKRKKCIIL